MKRVIVIVALLLTACSKGVPTENAVQGSNVSLELMVETPEGVKVYLVGGYVKLAVTKDGKSVSLTQH